MEKDDNGPAFADRPTVGGHPVDMHTHRGRRLGRGTQHFFEVGAQLVNPAQVEDPYRGRARAVRVRTTRDQEALPL